MNNNPLRSFTRSREEIEQRSGLETPPLLWPDASQLFAQRALRLRELAANHPMRDYLMLMAVVCEAQQEQVQQPFEAFLPTAEQLAEAAQSGQPPLDATRWPRHTHWRQQWRALLAKVLEQFPHASPARSVLQTAIELDDTALEQQADRLLAGISLGTDLATAPLIAAGLQLHFTQLVNTIGQSGEFAFIGDHHPRCPCCGSLPTASITRLGGSQEGQRYLHCSLCASQWHMNRLQCSHCGTTDGQIEYKSLQSTENHQQQTKRPSIEAEVCGSCRHYLKILHMGQDLHVEPVADDLASLTLDLLVAEAGYERHGANLLLLFGDDQLDSGMN